MKSGSMPMWARPSVLTSKAFSPMTLRSMSCPVDAATNG
jgi:hypothetical protein